MNYSDSQGMGGTRGTLGSAMHYDRERSIHDIVRDNARNTPDATAVVFENRSVTYRELDRMSDGAAALLMRLGVRKGDIVAIQMPRSLDTIVAKLAILKAGAAYLPLDKAFPAEHINFVLEECTPRVTLIDSMQGGGHLPADSANTQIVTYAEIARGPEDVPVEWPVVGGGDAAYVMYTSGSTGRPKGVAVPHRGVTRLVLDQNFVEFKSQDVVLHTATIAFDAATFEIWGGLLNGCTVAVMPAASLTIPGLCDVIRSHNVSITLLTTGLFNLFADYSSGELPTLRHVLFGGEVGSAEHVRRFQKAHRHCRLTNCYGPTEGSCMATTFEVPPGFEGSELPIGKAIRNTGIHILDEELNPLPAGAEGQLAISGDGVAIGYFRRPDITAEKFVTGNVMGRATRCYLTGDLAMFDEEGNVAFKGRRDRQVKINGKRIELDEIEAALRRDYRLSDAAVECHQQGTMKRIVAYLCPKKKEDIGDPEFGRVVMATLRTVLPAYMIPSAAVVMKELPLTPAGKVERSKLLPLPEVDAQPSVPQSRCEEIVTKLWRDALATDAVSVDRNFFDLGGTSLQLLRVHAGLEEELGQTIDVFALFQHPTIRELVRFLEGKSANDVRSMSVDQRAILQRKTLFQFRRSAS